MNRNMGSVPRYNHSPQSGTQPAPYLKRGRGSVLISFDFVALNNPFFYRKVNWWIEDLKIQDLISGISQKLKMANFANLYSLRQPKAVPPPI